MSTLSQQELQHHIQQIKALIDSGQHDQARAVLEPIVPPRDQPAPLFELGYLARSLGNYPKSIDFFSQCAEIAPNNIGTLLNLAASYQMNNSLAAAAKTYNTILSLEPNHIDAQASLGMIYFRLGDCHSAKIFLEQARAQAPDDRQLLVQLALAQHEIQDVEDALQNILHAIEIEPSDPFAYVTAGKLYSAQGEMNTAREYYAKALALNPLLGSAYKGIIGTKKYTTDDRSFVDGLEKLLDENLEQSDREGVHFSLGKVYDDLKEWDKSFLHYQKGNQQNPIPAPSPPTERFKVVLEVCNAYLKEGLALNCTQTPIFILGMPRSGSTLTEQILAAHPKVASVGEMGTIAFIGQAIFFPEDKAIEAVHQHFTTEKMSQHGQRYLEALTRHHSNVDNIVDKTPVSFMYIGLLKILFPKARFIHTGRHPLDVGLSCYFQMFERLAWSTDLEKIGETYCYYRSCIDAWKSSLPTGTIYDMRYEDLVENPELEIRNLLAYCGLEWHPDCMEYFNRKSSINTASVWQARQPIYQSSKQRWTNYCEYLDPLVRQVLPYLTEADIKILRENGLSL